MPIKFHEGSKTFHIYNKHLSYITCIMENGQSSGAMHERGWAKIDEKWYYATDSGKAIRDKEDFSYLHEEIMRSLMAVCVPEPGLLSMQYTKQEYPVYGTGDYRNPALTVRQENGSEIVDAVLTSLKVKEYFDAVVTACEVAHGKPEPDIYLEVAKRLGVQPENCLVFEDIPAGIMAGKAAGVPVIAMEDDFSADLMDEKRELADAVISDYRELL